MTLLIKNMKLLNYLLLFTAAATAVGSDQSRADDRESKKYEKVIQQQPYLGVKAEASVRGLLIILFAIRLISFYLCFMAYISYEYERFVVFCVCEKKLS